MKIFGIISLIIFSSIQILAQGQWYVSNSNGSNFAGNTTWGTSGTSGSTRFLADVTGDGRADAVSFSAGVWEVAKSTGKKFDKSKVWLEGFGNAGTRAFAADVNGDGKADAVAYNPTTGDWYVCNSTGSKFKKASDATVWISGHGIGSQNQFLADVNGDRKADSIVYFANKGDWYVALSNGKTFNAFSQWTSGHGIGSNSQHVGDVDGDGKVDSIVFFANRGDWYVAPSNGNGFSTFFQWATGHGIASNAQFVADLNGDRKADSVVYFANSGSWFASVSNGSSAANRFTKWLENFGTNSPYVFLADVTGDSKADAIVAF